MSDRLRTRTRALADARGYFDGAAGVNLEAGGEAHRLATTFVEPGLFDLLGARPLLGRLFLPEESEPGRTEVTLLGEGLWRDLFAADPGIVGRRVTLDGRSYEVVGVLPASWSFPDPADRLWIPLAWNPGQPGPFWGSGGIRAVGRLTPGASPASATEELRGFSAAISAANPVWTPDPEHRARAEVVPLREALVGDARPTLMVLLAAVSAVLLVVCANVSSLLVARSLERGHEVALRTALGAGRARVAREALAESALLGIAGALLGGAVARVGLALLRPGLSGRLPRAEELAVDPWVLAGALAVGVDTGLAAGVVPALRAARRDPGEALRSGGRGAGPGHRRRRASRLLVAAQVAAATALVTSATLLARSLAALAAVDPGFRTERILTADVTFPSVYEEASAAARYDALVERVRTVPGVEDATLAATVPFGSRREVNATFIEDVTTDPNDLPVIPVDRVAPSYFGLMGIPLHEGRAFTSADRAEAPPVAIVDEEMARAFWPGSSPLGRRLRYPWAGAPWIEVVGVVGSVADRDLGRPREPRWYVPLAQRPGPEVTLLVRTSLPGAAVVPGVRRAVAEVDRRLPVSRVAAHEDLVGEASIETRLTASTLAAFALTALLLGCLGVYGLSAHAVRERRREIGLRMALGAGSAAVARDVLVDGVGVAGPGALAGLLAAAGATRLLSGMLYGVRPLDPLTFAAAPLLLLAAALAAVWIPARRAARIDPTESLREG